MKIELKMDLKLRIIEQNSIQDISEELSLDWPKLHNRLNIYQSIKEHGFK